MSKKSVTRTKIDFPSIVLVESGGEGKRVTNPEKLKRLILSRRDFFRGVRDISYVIAGAVVAGCGVSESPSGREPPTPKPTEIPKQTEVPIEILEETSTPTPTPTPTQTFTPPPTETLTSTPEPTKIPKPTPTETPRPPRTPPKTPTPIPTRIPPPTETPMYPEVIRGENFEIVNHSQLIYVSLRDGEAARKFTELIKKYVGEKSLVKIVLVNNIHDLNNMGVTTWAGGPRLGASGMEPPYYKRENPPPVKVIGIYLTEERINDLKQRGIPLDEALSVGILKWVASTDYGALILQGISPLTPDDEAFVRENPLFSIYFH